MNDTEKAKTAEHGQVPGPKGRLLAGLLKRLAIDAIVMYAALQLVALAFVDYLMFHPVKGGYDATLCGYVDIGTNGVPVAAVVRGPQKGRKAIIYCHGNAEDITSSIELFDMFAQDGYTVASVDYPSYGLSGGSADEEGCCRNVHRLYDWLRTERGYAPDEIVVIGFSIGTGPAIELAATESVGALVLEAAYLSAPRIVTKVRILAIDPFPNLKRIGYVRCPLLAIHGTSDSIVPFAHGKALFELANEPKRFVPVTGADHDDFIDVLGLECYRSLIKDFINCSFSSEPQIPGQ